MAIYILCIAIVVHTFMSIKYCMLSYSGPYLVYISDGYYSQDGVALFCLVVDIIELSLDQLEGIIIHFSIHWPSSCITSRPHHMLL